MKLTLAGPGSGKTTNLVEQIKNATDLLKCNRDMAIITYTNASVADIKEKLLKVIEITPNIFIGTIHSFLMHYFIIPHADALEYDTSQIMVVDKLSEDKFDWIDKWVDDRPNMSKSKKQTLKSGIRQKQINLSLEGAAKKGVYTYDSILKTAYQLSKKTEIIKAISNKLQYLFVDEYQDISSYGHKIVMAIEKRKRTEISVVGDPDQSIYRFRYGQSQIGERAPKAEKRPIIELKHVAEKQCCIEKLLVNHRSTEEIVQFLHKYSTLDDQIAEKGKLCKIQFINSCDALEIQEKFEILRRKYDCKNGMILAEKNSILKEFSKNKSQEFIFKQNQITLKKITDFVISFTGLSYEKFIETYEFTPYMLRRICVPVRNKMLKGNLSEKEIKEMVKRICKELYGKNIRYEDSLVQLEDKKQYYNFFTDFQAESTERIDGIKCMTIHKAKGLEADAVLVIAQSANQLFKWLNMTKSDMEKENDEEYRLGYVAFSRAKKVLAIAAMQEINVENFDKEIWDIL